MTVLALFYEKSIVLDATKGGDVILDCEILRR